METLHQRIRADVERKILSGEWPPGHRIPFEHELSVAYGCSRMTVNKALSSLAAAGLLERRRKAGSFVARPRMQSAVLAIPDLQAEILGRGETYRYELLAWRRRRAAREDGLGFAEVEPLGDVLDLTCRHFAGDIPFVLEERLINLDAAPEAAAVDFSTRPPGTWLLEHVPWTQAEHKIVAVNAGQAYAGPLGVTPEAACLLVERRTWREGRTLTRVRQIFPGSLYSLTARFAPAGR